MFRKLRDFAESLPLLAPAAGVSFWWHFADQDLLQYVPQEQSQSPYMFCTRVKEAPVYGLSNCRRDHMELTFREALLKREPFLQTCHAGLILLAVPLFLNEELAGILFAGPVRTAENKFSAFAADFRDLPCIDRETLLALGRYLEREMEFRFAESESGTPGFRLLPQLSTRNRQVLACAHIMRKCRRQAVSVDEIAHRIGISRSSLLHKFKQETGLAWSDWLQRLRVSDALHLVEGTDLALTEIAQTCHFADQSRMTLLFRRYLGRTPGWIRRKRQPLCPERRSSVPPNGQEPQKVMMPK